MKTLSKISFSLLILWAMAVSGCGEKKTSGCECIAGCDSQAQLRDMYSYFLFEPGSYWVYEEETTKAIDTLTLYEVTTGTNIEGGPWFRAKQISSYDGYKMEYNFTDTWSSKSIIAPNCQCHKVTRVRSKSGDFVGEQKEMTFPPIAGNYIYTFEPSNYNGPTPTRAMVAGVHDRYQLGSLEFSNVAEYYIDNMFPEWNQPGRLFMAKGVGLIRKELHDDGLNWNLIAYDVLPK